jgi:hypothetical protein
VIKFLQFCKIINIVGGLSESDSTIGKVGISICPGYFSLFLFYLRFDTQYKQKMSSAPQLLLQHSLLKDDAKRFSEYLGYRIFKKPDDRCEFGDIQ